MGDLADFDAKQENEEVAISNQIAAGNLVERLQNT